MNKKYDFGGWATKNNLLCADGRTILENAFEVNDGQTVPLVWNHQHNDSFNVLGHAMLENRPEGVYAYCYLNDTMQGENLKQLIQHGDVNRLSIFANELKQKGQKVLHGVIREVSVVLAGSNPGAIIDDFSFAHSEDGEEYEAIIYSGESLELSHSDEDDDEQSKPEASEDTLSHSDDKKEEKENMDDVKKEEKNTNEDDKKKKTVKEVFDSMTEEQQKVTYAMIGAALEEAKGDDDDEDDNEGGKSDMKHNVFEEDEQRATYLSHSDMEKIFADAKRVGSLREAVNQNIQDGVLAHSIDTTGMETPTGTQTYGFRDPEMLFPEYRTLNNPPEWIKRDTNWVQKFIGSVHHTPFSRIKSVYADITEDDARALGYIKGKMKKEEVFTLLKRTTSPMTIYKKQKMDRDDLIDITDFDVVAWIRAEMRIMLNEEIARACLIGDGRNSASDDHIKEDNVRPIAKDVALFNTQVKISVGATADEGEIAKATINGAIRARKNYKGSGNPIFFTTEDVLTEMLLLEDGIGHKLYKTEAELATALRVREIVTVEVMENQKLDISGTEYPLIGIIVNPVDYNIGADRGGEINMFDDFDIDYNQQKYLIETRISGALIKPYSALTLVLDKA